MLRAVPATAAMALMMIVNPVAQAAPNDPVVVRPVPGVELTGGPAQQALVASLAKARDRWSAARRAARSDLRRILRVRRSTVRDRASALREIRYIRKRAEEGESRARRTIATIKRDPVFVPLGTKTIAEEFARIDREQGMAADLRRHAMRMRAALRAPSRTGALRIGTPRVVVVVVAVGAGTVAAVGALVIIYRLVAKRYDFTTTTITEGTPPYQRITTQQVRVCA